MPTLWHALLSTFLSGGWLILFAIMLRLVAACPASCAVCTRDVTLCHQLTYTVGNKTNHSKNQCSVYLENSLLCSSLYWLISGLSLKEVNIFKEQAFFSNYILIILFYFSVSSWWSQPNYFKTFRGNWDILLSQKNTTISVSCTLI